MGVAQGVGGAGVPVVGGERVVDGGAGEGGQDTHVVHRGLPAVRVGVQQGVGVGGGGVQPGQAALAAQTGLVEVRDGGGGGHGGRTGRRGGRAAGGGGRGGGVGPGRAGIAGRAGRGRGRHGRGRR